MLKLNIILICFVFFQSCSSDNSSNPKVINKYPITSVDSLILKSFTEKRIVMIGDNYHGHGYYHNIVTGFLNHWLDKVSNNDDYIPSKLALFIEQDSTTEKLIKEIIQKDIKDNYYNHLFDILFQVGGIELNSIDNLKFFYGLRGIQEKINEINKNNSANKIELRIIGAESDPPCNFERSLAIGMDSCQQENFEWFVYQRDKLSSENIINFLKNNEEFKALIFYGSGHLIRTLTDKQNINYKKTNKPALSYFLAHYLDKEFGRNGVEIFTSTNYSDQQKDFIYEYENDTLPDFELHNKLKPELPFPLLFIKNKMLLKIFIDLIQKNKEKNFYNYKFFALSLANQFKRSYLYVNPAFKKKIDLLQEYGYQLFRNNLEHYEEIISVAKELLKEFDPFEDIKQMEKWIQEVNIEADSSSYYSSLRSIIYNLPKDTTEDVFYSELRSSFQRNNLSSFEKNQIEKRMNEIKVYSLINFLWIADSDERMRAVKYLKEVIGENFNSNEEWDNWWMEKYKPSEKMFWN